MDHYRAYGGPKPPPIDHQGIESAGESADYRHALEPPLTKSARPVGDTEKVAQEWLRGASGFERRGYCRTRERPFPRNIGHFPQVRAGVPLTRSAESSLPDRMAPQTGLERMTFWLTAERRWRSHRCEQAKRPATAEAGRASGGYPTLSVDPVGALPAFRLEGLDGVTGFLNGPVHEPADGVLLPAHLLHDLGQRRPALALQHRHYLGGLTAFARYGRI